MTLRNDNRFRRPAQLETLETRQLFSGAVEGIPYQFKVGFNSHVLTYKAQPSDYEVEIHWGDGSVSTTRQITRIENFDSFYATDTHLYHDAGNLSQDLAVIVHNLKNGDSWHQSQMYGPVDDAPLHVTVNDLNITGNTDLTYSGVVANIVSDCKFDTADELTAYIYIPGSRVIGTVIGSGGNFRVSADLKFAHAAVNPIKVIIIDSDLGNAEGDGTANVSEPAVASKTASKIFKLNAEVQAYPTVTEFANEYDWTPAQTRAAVQDAVDAFANGIANPKAKPNQVAAAGSEKFPWSRSFFDAGRMLKGIATGTDNLVKFGQYITKNPQIFSTGAVQKLATQVASGAVNAVKSPDKLLGAVYGGFNAFQSVDPADLAGQAIPAGVAMEVAGAAAVAGVGKALPAAPAGKFGTAAIYSDGAGETFAASANTYVTVFGRGSNDVTWMLNAMKGLNLDTQMTNCVDVAMMLDLKLKNGISISTRVTDLGERSLQRMESFYGENFAATSRSGFENAYKGVKSEVRGILALPSKGSADSGHVINFVYKPGQGLWYLDGQLGTAYQQAAPETAKMFGAYAKNVYYIITNG